MVAGPRRKLLTTGLSIVLAIGVFYQIVTPVRIAGQGTPSNPRYGVIISVFSDGVVANVLGQLNMTWWYEFGNSPTNPSQYQKVQLIRTGAGGPQLTLAELQARVAASSPGSYWIIGNEPNVPGQDNISPQSYAESYYYYYTNLKAIDPQSKLVAPNILNCEFTCVGCPGIPAGHQWVVDFVQAYQTTYQTAPPIDVWGIHAYVIDWTNLPMVVYQTGIQQIQGLRQYLDSLPSQAGKPIWVTEFGVIWGYEGIGQVDGKASPQGAYREDLIGNYMRGTMEWLNANAASLNIERWFIYTSYGLAEPYATQYAGISLVDGPESTASLTNLGQLYRDLAIAGLVTPTPTPRPFTGGGGGAPPPGSTPTPIPTPALFPTFTPVPTATIAVTPTHTPVPTLVPAATSAVPATMVATPAPTGSPTPIQESMPVAQALAGLRGQYAMVITFDAADADDPWKLYDPAAPAYANDLSQLESSRGYWLKMRERSRLVVGRIQIGLEAGWNLIGWPRITTEGVG